MNALTSPEGVANNILSPEPAVESEIGQLVEQQYAARPPKIEFDSEHIKSSVAVSTSKSVKELEGLTLELQALQEFIKFETERVQRDIDSALAGVQIIIETISPWRTARQDAAVEKSGKPGHDLRLQRCNLLGGAK
jgi:hypothetical protein